MQPCMYFAVTLVLSPGLSRFCLLEEHILLLSSCQMGKDRADVEYETELAHDLNTSTGLKTCAVLQNQHKGKGCVYATHLSVFSVSPPLSAGVPTPLYGALNWNWKTQTKNQLVTSFLSHLSYKSNGTQWALWVDNIFMSVCHQFTSQLYPSKLRPKCTSPPGCLATWLWWSVPADCLTHVPPLSSTAPSFAPLLDLSHPSLSPLTPHEAFEPPLEKKQGDIFPVSSFVETFKSFINIMTINLNPDDCIFLQIKVKKTPVYSIYECKI